MDALEHWDMLIIGAGLSGIGAAVHLQQNCPERRFAILEARGAIGGTWDLFRYPGIRSDSDMYTLGYAFKPWLDEQSIAEGGRIRDYIQETARDYGLLPHIRFGHKLLRANWDSGQARWHVELAVGPEQTLQRMSCNFLHLCAGYFRYDQGHQPAFKGLADYRGTLVHAQHWPEGLDYAGKRVVVIGSGATAVTLVPHLAQTAAHVTMVQRSPTFVGALPRVDAFAQRMRALFSPARAYAIVRRKNIYFNQALYSLAMRWPQLTRRLLGREVRRVLGEGPYTQRHFNPQYQPWQQRLCVAPDGDLFQAIRAGKASVVTEAIANFTPSGIKLESGQELQADVVVMATGLQLLPLGGVQLAVDGKAVALNQTMTYKGAMLTGLPNLFFTIGYSHAAWTLKSDLVAQYACRLLQYMQQTGARSAVAVRDAAEPECAFLDLQSNYVLRHLHEFPQQGGRWPWRLTQKYFVDAQGLLRAPIADGHLRFEP